MRALVARAALATMTTAITPMAMMGAIVLLRRRAPAWRIAAESDEPPPR
jgi:hypothetical protein